MLDTDPDPDPFYERAAAGGSPLTFALKVVAATGGVRSTVQPAPNTHDPLQSTGDSTHRKKCASSFTQLHALNPRAQTAFTDKGVFPAPPAHTPVAHMKTRSHPPTLSACTTVSSHTRTHTHSLAVTLEEC